MTCDQFARQLDRLVIGDLRDAAVSAMQGHAADCACCGVEWRRSGGLRGLLAAARDDDPDLSTVGQARARLRGGLDRAGHPPIRFGSLTTPVGPLFVGVTDQGVCDVTFGQSSEQAYRKRLLGRSPEVWRDDTALATVVAKLRAYFAGELTQFSLPVDLRQVTPFTAKVLRETGKIRFGRLTSYGELAARIGAPSASRAVGGALGRNPVPIIVPCHRVIAQSGRIGGFTGGVPTKRILLDLEGYRFEEPALKLF
jgi:methylated-DNA-[protein]-cysteine S-methyltransferase